MTTDQAGTPSPDAIAAVESSQRDLEGTVRLLREADETFLEMRGYLEVNHIASKIQDAFRQRSVA